MLIGTIIHRAIAVWSVDRTRPIVEILDKVFDEALEASSVARSFQTELLRFNLRSDLVRFAQESLANPMGDPAQQRCETDIRYAIDDERKLIISGRIDRYDVFGDNAGLVVDYKYSSDSRVDTLIKEHDQGVRLQAPLYLLGLQRNFGIRPAGMRFWGLRRKTSVKGWIDESIFPREQIIEKGDQALSSEALQSKLEDALKKARKAIDEIRAGRIAVEPRDERFCEMFCDFRDICRVEL
jgi:ATP-dependent helicase/DNAse subunit B